MRNLHAEFLDRSFTPQGCWFAGRTWNGQAEMSVFKNLHLLLYADRLMTKN